MIWCEMHRTKIIGLYLISEHTVNVENHRKDTSLLCYAKDIRFAWISVFQQDCTPKYWTIDVPRYLDTKLPGKQTRRGGKVAWPAKSPHSTSLDVLMWIYYKNYVFNVQI